MRRRDSKLLFLIAQNYSIEREAVVDNQWGSWTWPQYSNVTKITKLKSQQWCWANPIVLDDCFLSWCGGRNFITTEMSGMFRKSDRMDIFLKRIWRLGLWWCLKLRNLFQMQFIDNVGIWTDELQLSNPF